MESTEAPITYQQVVYTIETSVAGIKRGDYIQFEGFPISIYLGPHDFAKGDRVNITIWRPRECQT